MPNNFFQSRFRLLVVVMSMLAFVGISDFAKADDWPQILGPSRNGIAANEKIADSFPADGPKVEWESPVGAGFAGPAVFDSTVYIFHRKGDSNVLEARSASGGKKQWDIEFPTSFSSGYSSDNGPRCVPLVTKKHVYVFGAAGGLYCVDRKSGKKIWGRQTHKEYKAQAGFFGAGSSPLLEDGKLIVNVGSREDAGIVAFDAKTGKTLWQTTDNQASYSSPVAVTIDGVRHVLVVTRYRTVSLDPKNGAVRFSFPFGKRGPTVNGSNPVVIDDKLFLTASYGIGSLFRTIDSDSSSEIWNDPDGIASQYSTFVPKGKFLFGIDGRQDNGSGSATLMCFEPATRKVKWKQSRFDYGSVLLADNKLIVLTNTGNLILAKADENKFQQLAKANVLPPAGGGYRLPALSNGRLFVRGDSVLKCLDISR